MANTVLDLSVIDRTPLGSAPYPHLIGESLIRPERIADITASFPQITTTGFHPVEDQPLRSLARDQRPPVDPPRVGADQADLIARPDERAHAERGLPHPGLSIASQDFHHKRVRDCSFGVGTPHSDSPARIRHALTSAFLWEQHGSTGI